MYLQMHNELGSGLEVTGVAVYICKQSYSVNYEKRVIFIVVSKLLFMPPS